jgi:hypothetical protein
MTDEAIPNHANLVGKALYLEFRKGVNTAQIIVTPEGIDNTGKYVPVSTWRRQVSSWSPKKPWRCYATANTDVVSIRKDMCIGEIKELSDPDHALTLARKTIVDLTTTLNNLYNADWEIIEKPLVIEFSLEDLIATASWDTPQALIRRIGRARKEAGYPDELITEIVE